MGRGTQRVQVAPLVHTTEHWSAGCKPKNVPVRSHHLDTKRAPWPTPNRTMAVSQEYNPRAPRKQAKLSRARMGTASKPGQRPAAARGASPTVCEHFWGSGGGGRGRPVSRRVPQHTYPKLIPMTR